MNNFIDVLFKTIAITFLLVLTLFLFSLLIEYVRFLILRHRTNKAIDKIMSESGKELVAPNLNEEQLEKLAKAIEEQVGGEIDNIQVVKFDKKKKEKE